MNWTDRLLELRIRRVWTRHIQPAAASLRDRGVEVFDLDPDDEAASWYRPVDPQTPQFVEISDLETTLREIWTTGSLTELASIAAKIAALSDHLQDEAPRQTELSADVYAMY